VLGNLLPRRVYLNLFFVISIVLYRPLELMDTSFIGQIYQDNIFLR